MHKVRDFTPRPPLRPPDGRRQLIVSILLLALVVVIFAQVGNHEFVAWDDTSYVSENERIARGLTGANIVWAFTNFHLSNWHPLTLISHMADVSLWGMNAGRHALVNATFHALNVVLLFLFFARQPGAQVSLSTAAAIAGLWAAHPLHVESVAWISERKDVLSAFFWLLSMHAYARWTRSSRRWDYLMTTAAIACAMMSKPMAVGLPAALICLDIWPLRRTTTPFHLPQALPRLFLEKWPWWVMAAATAVLTVTAQTRAMPDIGLAERLTTGFSSLGWYLGKTLWPSGLHFYYLNDGADALGPALLALGVIIAVSIWVIRKQPERPWLLAGWGWFLLTLLPVVGFVKVGTQAYADRYAYLPHVGLFFMIVVELYRNGERVRHAVSGVLALVVTGLMVTSFVQVAVWKNTQSLYLHALRHDQDHYVALMGMANLALRNQDYSAAYRYAMQALARSTGSGLVNSMRIVLGEVALARGRPDQAITEFIRAREADPTDALAPFRLGVSSLLLGRGKEAERWLRQAISQGESGPELYNNLGISLAMQGRHAEAYAIFLEARTRWPQHSGLALNLEELRRDQRSNTSQH